MNITNNTKLKRESIDVIKSERMLDGYLKRNYPQKLTPPPKHTPKQPPPPQQYPIQILQKLHLHLNKLAKIPCLLAKLLQKFKNLPFIETFNLFFQIINNYPDLEYKEKLSVKQHIQSLISYFKGVECQACSVILQEAELLIMLFENDSFEVNKAVKLIRQQIKKIQQSGQQIAKDTIAKIKSKLKKKNKDQQTDKEIEQPQWITQAKKDLPQFRRKRLVRLLLNVLKNNNIHSDPLWQLFNQIYIEYITSFKTLFKVIQKEQFEEYYCQLKSRQKKTRGVFSENTALQKEGKDPRRLQFAISGQDKWVHKQLGL